MCAVPRLQSAVASAAGVQAGSNRSPTMPRTWKRLTSLNERRRPHFLSCCEKYAPLSPLRAQRLYSSGQSHESQRDTLAPLARPVTKQSPARTKTRRRDVCSRRADAADSCVRPKKAMISSNARDKHLKRGLHNPSTNPAKTPSPLTPHAEHHALLSSGKIMFRMYLITILNMKRRATLLAELHFRVALAEGSRR